MHPDKIADRIAGAIVDIAYEVQESPKVAAEVLIGHGECTIIIESSVDFNDPGLKREVIRAVERIAKEDVEVSIKCVPQDVNLANNQTERLRCGDNGIFKGVPVTTEQAELANIAREIYGLYRTDGKYILDNGKLIICQSNALYDLQKDYKGAVINPLGFWTGGINVDSGATNRKLGSDMGDSITGGGLHGKDLSKADVSINIYAWLKAQETGCPVEISCAIGDELVDGLEYSEIVAIAADYIEACGGFEKFAEWGLI